MEKKIVGSLREGRTATIHSYNPQSTNLNQSPIVRSPPCPVIFPSLLREGQGAELRGALEDCTEKFKQNDCADDSCYEEAY